jgi:hypothetical protein
VVWVNRYLARRTRRAPKIDGNLGDAAWAAAPANDSFIEPGAGPVNTTRLRVLWDARNIYLAVENLQSSAVRRSGDDLEVMLQPDVASPEHLDLRISPAGTTAGSLIARTAVHGTADRGWQIEMAAPLAQIKAGGGRLLGQRWGLNLFRHSVWSRPLPGDPHSVDQCGDLIFANEEGDDPSSAVEEEEEQNRGQAVYQPPGRRRAPGTNRTR